MRTILGLALVAMNNGEIEVNLDSLKPVPPSRKLAGEGFSFGDDYGDDFGDDVGDDFGDDVGDDVGDDIGEGDEDEYSADEVGAERRRHRHHNHVRRPLRKRRMFGNIQTFAGAVQGSVGAAVSATFTPTATLKIEKIIATGDTGAIITTIMAGQRVIFAGTLAAAVLATGNFSAPLFENKWLMSGEPVTVNYTSGSNSVGLQLTFSGKTPGHRVRC